MKKTTRKYLIATAVMLVGLVFVVLGDCLYENCYPTDSTPENDAAGLLFWMGLIISAAAAAYIDSERQLRK